MVCLCLADRFLWPTTSRLGAADVERSDVTRPSGHDRGRETTITSTHCHAHVSWLSPTTLLRFCELAVADVRDEEGVA